MQELVKTSWKDSGTISSVLPFRFDPIARQWFFYEAGKKPVPATDETVEACGLTPAQRHLHEMRYTMELSCFRSFCRAMEKRMLPGTKVTTTILHKRPLRRCA